MVAVRSFCSSREVGIKTVYTINRKWWGHPTGNVTQIV
jgi:hypothetical protein